MSVDTKTIVTELRQQLETIYGKRLFQLILFGSQARGEASPGSDIDVLVVLQGLVSPGVEIARIGETTSALSLKYDVVVSCIFVSEERYKHEQSPLLLNVRREGVVA